MKATSNGRTSQSHCSTPSDNGHMNPWLLLDHLGFFILSMLSLMAERQRHLLKGEKARESLALVESVPALLL